MPMTDDAAPTLCYDHVCADLAAGVGEYYSERMTAQEKIRTLPPTMMRRDMLGGSAAKDSGMQDGTTAGEYPPPRRPRVLDDGM